MHRRGAKLGVETREKRERERVEREETKKEKGKKKKKKICGTEKLSACKAICLISGPFTTTRRGRGSCCS